MNQIIPDRIGVANAHPEVTGYRPQGTDCGDQMVEVSMSRDDGQAMRLSLKPLHDRVLVQRDVTETTTSGGIIVPHIAREKALRGTVLAAGPGKRDAHGIFQPTAVKPGDRVVFSASVNVPYPDLVEDGELVMMSEADILGILTTDSH